MASYFYTNFVPTLLHALFVFQALEFCYPHALTNVSCIDAEREALLKFKQDLIDPSRNLLSWTGKRCCEWEGVKCNHRTSHVSQLNLIGRGLGGKIDPALSELRCLKYLRLGNNNFNGHLPNQCGNFKHLEFTSLSHNSISGHIPSTIGQLASLRHLDLSYNNLSGNIPESIGQLRNLELMHFGNNRLHGVVNELHLANLTSLTQLSLQSNELVINVSASWVPPFQIIFINLSSCKVGPEFPNWLQTQRIISELYMSNASISGEVPNWLLDIISNIELLDLSGDMHGGNNFQIMGKKDTTIKIGITFQITSMLTFQIHYVCYMHVI
ncbi:hypothetical protein ACJRO7_028155 [Eucalyptus globulus]|uniref:Leucine-rich repeat-containing N-terminal plant-type domain-containing protein n=1 Tax=Eucalyptus globulus TaxID=34317 RepID=A0ABD3JYK1_EUCGL